MNISSLNGIWEAYLNQLSSEKGVCSCGRTSDVSQVSTSFSEVLESQRARQLNRENYNRLKEAAGGKVSNSKTYTEKQSNTVQNTLLQYQKLLMNQAFLNSYGMNRYSGLGSFYGLSGLGLF